MSTAVSAEPGLGEGGLGGMSTAESLVPPEPARAPADSLTARAGRLFAAFRAGDRAAFDQLVRVLTPLLWQTVRSQDLDRSAAEDVVQTVWLVLLRNAAAVQEPRAVTAWLVTSARREAWRASRRAGAGRARPGTDADVGDQLATVPAPRQEEPDAQVVLAERDRLLWAHVQRLPQRCRQLLRVICFADRPDYDRLAQALGMPKGSIGPTRGRCLAKLRAALSDDPAWGQA
jgi:RNA polymerase sigma factor (sigma-70 family)